MTFPAQDPHLQAVSRNLQNKDTNVICAPLSRKIAEKSAPAFTEALKKKPKPDSFLELHFRRQLQLPRRSGVTSWEASAGDGGKRG